jgi:hypothetical protein
MHYTKTQIWLVIITIMLCGFTLFYFMLGAIIEREKIINMRVETRLHELKYNCANEVANKLIK